MIKLENVSKSYAAGIPALNDVSLHIETGEFVFVVGDSGSGKSTLIKLLLKELEPTSGSIVINGQRLGNIRHRDVPRFRRNLGVVFQDFRLLKDRNVYENVAFAQRVIGKSAKSMRRKVPAVQQRVAIARALVNEPKILLADEPTGNLDSHNAWDIMKLLDEINQRGTTVLVVTHNLDIVKTMKKRVITMKKGVVVSDERAGDANED